jgi:hypothetical protein
MTQTDTILIGAESTEFFALTSGPDPGKLTRVSRCYVAPVGRILKGYLPMRTLTTLIVLIAATLAFAQTRPASPVLDGSWKSPDLGLDFPIWMVDTYNADGTVQTDFYSKAKGKEIHHNDKAQHARWRIANNALEVGELNDAGEFKRDGQPRRIKTDASGKFVAIDGWTRLATTQPTSQPAGGR